LSELFDRVAGYSGSGAADRQNVLVVVVVLVGRYGVLTLLCLALSYALSLVFLTDYLFVR